MRKGVVETGVGGIEARWGRLEPNEQATLYSASRASEILHSSGNLLRVCEWASTDPGKRETKAKTER